MEDENEELIREEFNRMPGDFKKRIKILKEKYEIVGDKIYRIINLKEAR